MAVQRNSGRYSTMKYVVFCICHVQVASLYPTIVPVCVCVCVNISLAWIGSMLFTQRSFVKRGSKIMCIWVFFLLYFNEPTPSLLFFP